MLFPFLAALLLAETLKLEEGTLRQFEDGPPYEQSYRPGEQVFFDLRVTGYARTEDENPVLKLKWTFKAVDAAGRLLDRPVDGKLEATLNAQDKEYRPRARFSAAIPQFALDGGYTIEAVVKDEVADKTVEAKFPFRVRGKQLAKDAPLAAGNARFYRREEDVAALVQPVYRAGAEVWLRFDLEGYSLSDKNAFHVNYGVTVTGPDGKQFLKQDPAAADEGQPSYPQAYVPATFVIKLPPKALPGEYRVAIAVRDLQGEKEQTTAVSFRVE